MKSKNYQANRLFVWLLSMSLVGQPVTAGAQVVVDTSSGGTGQAYLDQSQNGVDIVNISTASKAGVSHNQFSEFNVSQRGIILNNSQGEVNSELGGYITGNANLRNGSADIILNEVTGGQRSALEGYTEIAGSQAEYVLANRWGITCDGCGFINTPRVTLATGVPNMVDGALRGLRVTGGDVAILGDGLNASNVEYVDILTRSMEVNALVHADRLRIVTGANEVDYASGQVQRLASNDEQPALALDSSALGGMYANAITLRGTENGVGVRLAGDMATDAGSLIIDQTGQVEVNNLSSANRMMLSTTDSVKATGNLQAHLMDIWSGGDIELLGSYVVGGSEVDLRGSRIINRAEVAAGYDQSGEAGSDGLLLVSASEGLDNTGKLLSSDRLRLFGSELNNSGSNAVIQSKGALDVDAQRLNNIHGAALFSQSEMHLQLSGALDNTGGFIASTQAGLEIVSQDLSNVGGFIRSEREASINVQETLDNADGRIEADGALSLEVSGSLSNSGGSIGGANGQGLDFSGDLDNKEGNTAFSDNSLTLTLNQLDNRGGQIAHSGQGVFELNIAETLLNQDGYLASAGSINVTADQIENESGYIGAADQLSLTVSRLDNTLGGLRANRLNLDANSLNNHQGLIEAARFDIAVKHDLANTGIDGSPALIRALSGNDQRSVLTVGGTLDNQFGQLQWHADEMFVSSGALLNKGGLLWHGGTGLAEVESAGTLDNRSGVLVSKGDLSLAVQDLRNEQGLVRADQALYAEVSGWLKNESGVIRSGGSLGLNVIQAIDNSTGLIDATGAMKLSATTLDNRSGQLMALGDMSLTLERPGASSLLDNRGGYIDTGSNIWVSADDIDNRGGTILEGGAGDGYIHAEGSVLNRGGRILSNAQTLTLSANYLDNRSSQGGQAGVIRHAGDDLKLITRVELLNQGGRVTADGNVLLEGDTDSTLVVDNSGGRIDSDGAIRVEAEQLDNVGGSLVSEGVQRLNIAGDLNNRNGLLETAGSHDVTAARLMNQLGLIQSSSEAASAFETPWLNNSGGMLVSNGDTLSITANRIINREEQGQAGAIHHAGSGELALTASALLDNRGGELISNRRIRLADTGTVDNRHGQVFAPDVTAEVGSLDNSGGSLSGRALNLHVSGELLNNMLGETRGLIAAMGNGGEASFSLTAGGQLNNSGGTLQTDSERMHVVAGALTNDLGRVLHVSQGSFSLTASAGEISNRNGVIVSEGSVDASSLSLDNEGGSITAESGLSLDAGAGALSNNQGLISAGGSLNLSGGSLENQQGHLFSAGAEDALWQFSGVIDNGGEVLSNALSFDVQAESVRNSGTWHHSGERLVFKLERFLLNAGGQIAAAAILDIDAPRVMNQGAASLYADTLTVTADEFLNTGESVTEGRQLVLAIADQLTNRNSVLRAHATDDSASLSIGGVTAGPSIDNRQGRIETNATDLRLYAEEMNNAGGHIRHAGGGDLVASSETLWNNQNGLVHSDGNITLTAADFDNSDSGTVRSLSNMVLTTLDSANNSGSGLIDVTGALSLNAASFDNRHGSIFSVGAEDTTISVTGQLNNTDGLLLSNADDLFLDVGSLLNRRLDSEEGGVISHAGSGNFSLVVGGPLANEAGSLGSAAGLNISSTDAVNNSGGQLFAKKELILESNSLDNSSGLLQGDHLQLTIEGDLLNTGGAQLTAVGENGDANSLHLSVGGLLNNHGGALSSNQTVYLSAGSLNNRGGSISAFGFQGTSDIAVDTVFDNTNGSLYLLGGEDDQGISIGEELINRDGSLLHGGVGTLSLTAEHIDNITREVRYNSQGEPVGAEIVSNGTLEVQGFSEINNQGLEGRFSTISAGILNLVGQGEGVNLNNQLGAISASWAGLSMNQLALNNEGGKVTSNGFASLDLQGLSNSGGLLESQTSLELTLDDFTFGEGEIGADELLSINTAGDLTLAAGEEFGAAGSLAFTLGGDFTNHGKLTAAGNLLIQSNATSAVVLNSDDAVMKGGDSLDIRYRRISNSGLLIGDGHLILRGSSLANHGQIVGGEHLSSRVDQVQNFNLVFSGGTMDFGYPRGAQEWATGINNLNGATIFSVGDMELRGRNIRNRSSRIESYTGNTTIITEDLLNDVLYDTAILDEMEVYTDGGGFGLSDNFTSFRGEREDFLRVEIAPESQIGAGQTLTIHGGRIHNRLSTLSAGGDMILTGDTLVNEAVAYKDRHFRYYTGHSLGEDFSSVEDLSEEQHWESSMILAGGTITGDFSGQVQNSEHIKEYDDGHNAHAASHSDATIIDSSVGTLNAQSVSEQQQAEVAGDFIVSDVEAQSATSNAQSQEIAPSGVDVSEAAHQSAEVDADTSVGGSAQLVTSEGGRDGSESSERGNDEFASSAGDGSEVGADDPVLAEGSGPPEPPPAPVDSGSDIELAEIYNPVDNLRLPQDDSLFVIRPDQQANYLVETNPLLTSYLDFISSDYLLERLGINPAEFSKRLGDGFYETDLVREAIWSTRGRRYLTDTGGVAFQSDREQFQYLMDNALLASEDLELSPGVSLTAEQASQLTQDIVWLEEQEVDGQKVLAPVYYATTANGSEFNGDGAVIAGANVDINADGGFENDGTIGADGYVSLRSENDFSNTGRVSGGGDVFIDAASITSEQVTDLRSAVLESREGSMDLIARTGDIATLDGRVSAGDLSLTALEGQIENRADIQARDDLVAYAKTHVVSVVQTDGEGGRITAGSDLTVIAQEGDIISRSVTRSDNRANGEVVSLAGRGETTAGGNLLMRAGRDIEVTAGDVSAGGNAALRAERDINLDTLETSETNTRFDVSSRRTKVTRTTATEQEVTQVDAGGDLALSAGRDLTTQGTGITAEENVDLHAERDMQLLSVSNSRSEQMDSTTRGSLGRRESHSEREHQTEVVGTQVRAGGNITVNSAIDENGTIGLRQSRDVQIQGSQLVAGGDLVVGAQRDLAVEGDTEQSSTASQSREQDWSGLTSRRDWEVNEETRYVGSELVAANDAITVSGRHTDIVGSHVAAANDIDMRAGVTDESGNLTLSEGQETHREYEATQKRSPTASFGADKNSVNAFVGNQREYSGTEQTQVLGAGSTLTAGNNLNAQAGHDLIVVGGDITAANDASFSAENDVLFMAGRTETFTEQEQSTTRQGLGMTLNHNLGDAKDALGNLGRGDNAVSKASSVLRTADALSNVQTSASVHFGETSESSQVQTQSQGARASTVNAGNNLSIDAGNDNTIIGTQLNAGGDMLITGQDVTLDTLATEHSQQQSTDYKQTGTTLQASGANASWTVGYNKAGSEQNTVSAQQLGNELTAGGDITVRADNDLLSRGTYFEAGNDLNLNGGNDVTVLGAISGQRLTSNSSYEGGGAGLNVGEDGVGFTAHAAGGRDRLDRHATENTNSQLNAGNAINITSGNDTHISGANAQAKHLNLNVGGDLKVASVQDTGTVDGRREDYSGSVTIGAGVSGGANVGQGETDGSSAWVSNQTSLIGSESVDINVGGHTQIDGALIANIQEDGTDGGNLVLETDTIGYTDFEDYDQERSDYGSVGFGTGGSAGANAQTSAPEGFEGSSATVSFQRDDRDRQQITRATVGEGAITVRDNPDQDLGDLNRDINNAQEITRDKEESTDVYASTTAVDSLQNLTAEGDQNTLRQWGSNLADAVSPGHYAAMADNVAQLTNPEEIQSGWEQAKKTLGVTGELAPELDSKNQQLRDQVVQDLMDKNDGEVPDNLQLYLDQNGDIAAVEVDGMPVYMDADLEQQFATELEDRSQRLATELALEEQSEVYIDGLAGLLDDVWDSTDEQYYTALGTSNQLFGDLTAPGLGTQAERENLAAYPEWREPSILDFEAQYGTRRDMGDVGGELWDIGLTALGGGSRSLIDNTAGLGGLVLDGLAHGSQGMPGQLRYNVPGEAPLEIQPIGSQFAGALQGFGNNWAESSEPGAFSGGYQNEGIRTAWDTAAIIGGIGWAPRVGGARSGGVVRNSSVEIEPITDPSRLLEYRPSAGGRGHTNVSQPDELWVDIDGSVTRLGRRETNLKSGSLDTRQADMDFFLELNHLEEVRNRPRERGRAGRLGKQINEFIENIGKVLEDTQ